MTLDELEALPEMTSEFGVRTEIRNGKQVCIPVAPNLKALWLEPNDPMLVWDKLGHAWTVGRADGVRWKVRRREHDVKE